MKELKAGSLVWVKRKNGSWWPARIMGLNELSPCSRLKSGFAKPVRLLGRHYTSVDWYNLKSKRIKAFRCNEFNNFIKKAESLKASPSRKFVKYAYRTDAILHALELENKELGKKRKMTESYKNEPVCRSKRSRCVYLPVGSRKKSECTSFHAQSLPRQLIRMGGDSYQSSSSENNYSSRSTNTHSSDNYTPNGRADETSKQLSGSCSGYPGTRSYKKHEELSGLTCKDQTVEDDVEAPKRKIILKLKHLNNHNRDLPHGRRFITSENAIHDKSDPFMVDDSLKDYTRTGCYGKKSKKLIKEIYFSSQFQDGGLEITERQTRSTSSKKLLIDVNLTVESQYEGASVPLVSLTSKANKKSVIGYPIEVKELKNGSTQILLPINDDAGNQTLDDKGTLSLQSFLNTRTKVCYRPTTCQLTRPVRTTARRTPVSYLPTPSRSSIKKEFQAVNGPTREIHARLVKRENNSLLEEKLLNLPAVVTCVPVKLIFSRLVTAVGVDTEGQLA